MNEQLIQQILMLTHTNIEIQQAFVCYVIVLSVLLNIENDDKQLDVCSMIVIELDYQ